MPLDLHRASSRARRVRGGPAGLPRFRIANKSVRAGKVNRMAACNRQARLFFGRSAPQIRTTRYRQQAYTHPLTGPGMDRQAVVPQVRGQQPAQVVRREAHDMEVLFGQLCAAATKHDQHRRGRGHARDRAGVALDQEWHGIAHPPLVVVVALDEWNGAAMLAVPPDDRGDHGEQIRRHRDDALALGLGRGNGQQGDNLAVGA